MKITIGKDSVEITNPEKILFPKAKITKRHLVDYYRTIAPYMLPHIKNRPLTMDRYPQGITHETFYQKEAPAFFPSYIPRQPVKKNDGTTIEYPLVTTKAAILYLANYVGVPHVWLSRVPKLNYPDRMIFDLDPARGVSFTVVKWAAVQLKELLESLGLSVFLMTTGSQGLHVVVPLKQTMLFDDVREFARSIGEYLVAHYPQKLTLETRKDKRGKKIFVDTLRNGWSATSVAPYAVRALEGAPIATPITWQELPRIRSSQHYTIKNITQRMGRVGDVWHEINKKATTLTRAQKKFKLEYAKN